jgi:hypothetical protein
VTGTALTNTALAEHANAIRKLGKRIVTDVIEIGRRLVDCRDHHLKHGEWLPWLQKEFGWTEQTALNFIRVHEQSKSKNFLDLNLPVSSLYLLAAPSTREAARNEIAERAKGGEVIRIADVKRTIKKHGDAAKAPKPAANDADAAKVPDAAGGNHTDATAAAEARKAQYAALDDTTTPTSSPRPQSREEGVADILEAFQPSERKEQLEADARYAATLVEQSAEIASWLLDLLRDDERRESFLDALESAIEAEAKNKQREVKEARRRSKGEEVETTLEQALADAFEDLSGLGEECQEVVDNAAPGLDQTQRIQTLDETANALGSLEQPDVPSELEGLLVKYFPLTKSRQSRADRCGAACAIIEACIEALATVTESDPRHAAASDLSSELDGAMSTAIECEFPGMYG